MLNKLRSFNRTHRLIQPGEKIVCAVSGGADSIALLFGLYLLKEEWDLQLSAAHFNHHLREAESDRDEQFVRDFCSGYGIPLHSGSGTIVPGKKGLEAAAREARYAFLRSLPGKIATAHTADDNAETVLMHLVRGTGLKGLGGITPVNGNIIRPMLDITRADVESFLEEYCLPHVEDSSNSGDDFLRNRLRHSVMPLLKEENPRLAENLSAMALRLRQDEQVLTEFSAAAPRDIPTLRTLFPAVRARVLEQILTESGVKEPEAVHIRQAEALVFSDNPSARANFPGGITITRNYDTLVVAENRAAPDEMILTPGSSVRFGNYSVSCAPAEEIINTNTVFTVQPEGPLRIRPRQSGDELRLPGGTKSLKKLFIDRKIPAHQRSGVPVICDDAGILAAGGIGVNLNRAAGTLPATRIHVTYVK